MKSFILVCLTFVSATFNLTAQQVDCLNSIFNLSELDNEKYSSPFEVYLNPKWEEGFLTLNSGDTLYGELKLHRSAIKVKFRNQNKKKKYKAYKYISFKYGDRLFYQKTLDKFPVNAELIESGTISLYAHTQHSWIPFFRIDPILDFYAEKDSQIFLIHRGYWYNALLPKSWLEKCFSDYPELYEKINGKKLSYSEIIKSIRTYNCAISK